ncbi:MAG: ATP-binding protein, partial [Desulfobacterales bacterium]|nr:ATP-binding protein [Desulfobacterales bacterium]
MVKQLKKFKPAFWDPMDPETAAAGTGINFRRKWKIIVLVTTFLSLLPLFVMTLVDFNLTKRVIEDEVKGSMLKGLNSIATSVSSTLEQQKMPRQAVVKLEDFIAYMDTDQTNDLFIMDSKGILHTPSIYYGQAGERSGRALKTLEENSGFREFLAADGTQFLSGHVRIPGSDLILVQLRPKKWLTDLWLKPRLKLMGYLVLSIVLILISIMGMATFLMGRIHRADKKRLEALHHEEHANRLASIGRLASGVAHEINNPLDIINQKTGLMIDLLSMDKDAAPDDRLLPLAGDVIEAVKRCGTITRQLLDFARHMDPGMENVDIEEVVAQVVALLQKEADHRNIRIVIERQGELPEMSCDRGSLQQIFLNLAENAITAMDQGGCIRIQMRALDNRILDIRVSDTGKGIAEENLNK